MTFRGCLVASLILVAAAMACGPEKGQADGSTSTSSGDDASSSDTPTGSSTDVPVTCNEVHEGDLYVLDNTDLASLAGIVRVTGSVFISMNDRIQPDLSFLKCLQTTDGGLFIDMNFRLESTGGMDNLEEVNSLSITNNGNLRIVTGFDGITVLFGFEIKFNSSLEEIQFDSLTTVNWMNIGHCSGTLADAHHLALDALSGFSGLTEVDSINIDGNEVLSSVGLLDALRANGAPLPLRTAAIRDNPVLLESEVNTRLDELGVQAREVCGNLKGNPKCDCIVGE
ncbi:MAG: hypothetical protein IPO88_14025 [Nannocystis sp.]|uniref:hypothetical protein n=1 Tax=Nannocystis sp. TaxID=1962667 RepID=UPI002427B68E|nr:hypothetical protein [Nannocystis sp.]MBK9754596.1 hypothetical protein [Nannocystis sp.]